MSIGRRDLPMDSAGAHVDLPARRGLACPVKLVWLNPTNYCEVDLRHYRGVVQIRESVGALVLATIEEVSLSEYGEITFTIPAEITSRLPNLSRWELHLASDSGARAWPASGTLRITS